MTTSRSSRELTAAQALGRAMRCHRNMRGISQDAVASMIGCGLMTIRRLENGRTGCQAMYLDWFGIAVGVPAEDILCTAYVGMKTGRWPDDAGVLHETGRRGKGKVKREEVMR